MAENITLNNLSSLQNDTTAVNAINANNAAITTAFTDVLSRSGTQPNQMGSTLDMNSNHLINLPAPASLTEPLRLQDQASALNIGVFISPSLFDTRALAAAAHIGGAITWVETAGYSAAGDGGGALYKKVGGTTPGGFQSADGAWWQLNNNKDLSILQFGAVADDVTDNATAFQNAFTFMATINIDGSGSLYIPQGSYVVGSTVTSNAFVRMHGDDWSTSFIQMKPGVDATLFNFNSGDVQLENMQLWGAKAFNDPGTFGSSTPALIFGTNCHASIMNCKVFGGNPCIHFIGAEPYMFQSTASLSYGDIIKIEEGAWLNRCSFDVNLPAGTGTFPPTINPWVASTHYNVGDFASLGGYVIQCTVAGTTGLSSPALRNYAVNMVDNGATWQVFAAVNAIGLHMVGICQETHFHQLDNAFPIQIDTNPGGGGSFNFYITDSALEGVNANTGVGLYISHCEFGGSFTSPNGCVIGPSWEGDVSIIDNSFTNVGQYCVNIQGGTNTRIIGNTIQNSTTTAINVAGGVTDFLIADNVFNASAHPGITIQAGASDNFIIANNIMHSTAGISDLSTGTHKVIQGNGPGSAWTAAPNTQTGSSYTVLGTDSSLIFNNAGSATTVVLPAASTNAGRILEMKTTQAQAVNSNASNVVPRTGGAAGTAIITNTAGNWARLQSDGTNWIVMSST